MPSCALSYLGLGLRCNSDLVLHDPSIPTHTLFSLDDLLASRYTKTQNEETSRLNWDPFAMQQQPVAHGFRAAISLNNTAVTLMERGCVRQGLDTLQDAIFAMKESFHSLEEAELGRQTAASAFAPSSDERKCRTGQRLRRATHRMANPEPFSLGGAQIHSLSFDVGLTPVLTCLQRSPSLSGFFPIRIDLPMEWFTSTILSDPDFESAIILYNFGIANLLLAKAAPPCPYAGKCRATAVNVFQLASGILSARTQSCDDGMEEADLLQLALLVFHSTIQALVEAGNDAEALLVYERYDVIHQTVSSLFSAEWLDGSSKVLAAAA